MTATSVIKRLLKYAGHNIRYFVFCIIFSLSGVSLRLITPIITGKAIDNIIGENNVNFKNVISVIILLALTVILSAFFQWLTADFTNKLTYKTVSILRTDAYKKLNRTELKFIDSQSVGDVMTKVTTDIDLISDGLLQGFTQLFSGVITIAGTLILMLRINVRIALVVIVLTPLSLFASSFIARHTHDKFTEQSKIRGELGGISEEMITNHSLIKSFCSENDAKEKFFGKNADLYSVGVKAQFYSALTNPVTRFVNSVVYACVGVTGALSVIGIIGSIPITVGGLSCFLSYANQYTKPFNEISGIVSELQNAFAGAKRVFALLDAAEEESDKELSSDIDLNGDIVFDNVCFSYSDEKPLIENFSLRVKKGQKIAIVGPTGCGKTTLINLLMRFYDVDSGSIEIGQTDIREIKRDTLRSQFGMVLQNTWLFSATVKENISYGVESATDEEIVRAAKASHAHHFIKRLKSGYDTVISENGEISSGQKQLLCIARVMLRNPPILILDEATSNIDTRTEILVQRAFDEMMRNKTSFIVAHRLSTIRQADIVLVMNEGKIVEKGTHDELMSKKGFYYELYNSQFSQN